MIYNAFVPGGSDVGLRLIYSIISLLVVFFILSIVLGFLEGIIHAL